MRCAQAPDVVLAVLAALAAAIDIRYRRIPNWLVLAGIVAGFVVNSPGFAAAGFGIGFVLYFPLYLLRARGAGDVKLLAAVGAIVGPGNCFRIFVLTAVLGGAIAFGFVLLRGRVRRTLFNVGWILRGLLRFRAPWRENAELDVRSEKAMRLPHAALIAVGVFAFIVTNRQCL